MSKFRIKRGRLNSGPGEFHQSSSYHRYFEGWAEYETLTVNGKVKIKRVYVGDHHCIDLPRGTWNLLRCALWAAVILSMAIFIIGSVQNTVQNQNPLLAVLQVVTAGGYVTMFFALGSLRTKMTIYEYKSGPRALKKSGTITAIASALCLAGTIVISLVQNLILTGKPEVTALICYTVSALILAVVTLVACRLPITIEKNENMIPNGSVIIRKPGE